MPAYKPIEERDSDEVIGQYRSILDTMTSDLVKGWRTRFGNSDNVSANMTLARLLKEFSDFSWTYFERVVTAMPPTVRRNPLQIQRDLRRVIDNLQRNWGELMTACNQRENKLLRQRLEEADAEAAKFYECYQGFKAMVDGKKVMPITYFGSRYEITRYPYTPFPLLCYRYEAFGDRRLRLNGLAHELGHFIYWNIVPAEKSPELISAHHELDKLIEKTLSARGWELPDGVATEVQQRIHFDWMNWKTEMFADIVGALLIGPKYVETSMRLYIEELNNERGSIYAEDLVHPLPILRSLIALETLDLLPKVFGNQQKETNRLRNVWQRHFERATAPRSRRNDEGDEVVEQEFQVQREKAYLARQQTRAIVDLFLNKPVWPKLNGDGKKCQLIDLFSLEEEEYKDETEILPTQLKPHRVKTRKSFDQLANALEEIVRDQVSPKSMDGEPSVLALDDDMIAYQALLNLPLSEEQGSSGCILLRKVGPTNGNYIKKVSNGCNSGYYAQWVPFTGGDHRKLGE